MHFTDVGKDDFVPLKKSVRIFYDYYFDVLTIEFNGVDGFVEIPKEGNLSTTGITLGEFSRLYFETKEADKKHPPHIITIQEISNKVIRKSLLNGNRILWIQKESFLCLEKRWTKPINFLSIL